MTAMRARVRWTTLRYRLEPYRARDGMQPYGEWPTSLTYQGEMAAIPDSTGPGHRYRTSVSCQG
eukprot:7440457-Pyramimonas_sp.AAC.1